MKTSKMLLACIALSSLQLQLGFFWGGARPVVALFSATPLSAMVRPQKLASLLRRPRCVRQRGTPVRRRACLSPLASQGPWRCPFSFPERCCRLKSLWQVLKERAIPRTVQWQWRGRGRNQGSGTGATRPPLLTQVGQKAHLFFLLWKVCPWGPKAVDATAGSCAVDERSEFCHL